MDSKLPPTSRPPFGHTCLRDAALDFFHLQNRGYPARSAVQWVGNRYDLPQPARQLLLRGVFSQRDALKRRGKRVRGSAWQAGLLVVDGHNVHITVESGLLQRPLLLANDGALRDMAAQSFRFRFSDVSEMALQLVMRLLDARRPSRTLFLFDAPMSRSGHLAALYREGLRSLGLQGEARAVPVPEREIPYGDCVVASSDHAVLNVCRGWVDLARMALSLRSPLEVPFDFSPLILSHAHGEFFPPTEHFFQSLHGGFPGKVEG